MNRLLFCLFLLLCGVKVMMAADSSEQFLNAYQAYQQGEKLERDGSTSESLKKYRFAQSLLIEIEKNDPSWQKGVVEYRLKKTQEGLERLQGAGVSNNGSVNQSPVQSEGISPDASGGVPSISIVPPGAKSPSNEGRPASGDSSTEVRRLKRMLEALRGELKEAKDAMSSEKNRTKDLENVKWVEERSKLEKELQITKNQVGALNEKLQKRDSWENDLKSLQKKLDETLADKVAFEEEYQKREQKKDEANALLVKQLDESRQKLALSSAAEKKSQQLSDELDKARHEVAGVKEQLDHAVQATKDYEVKNEGLRKEMDSTKEKLNVALKQADELAPLRGKIQKLQADSVKAEADARNSKEKVSALESDTLKLQTDSKNREASLRADFQALEEERNKLSGKVAQLTEATRDAGKVKGLESDAESLKKAVLELQEKALLAGQEISKARADAVASAKEAKEAEGKLAANIAMASADRAVLEEEKQRLTVKLEDAVRKNEELGKIAATAAPLTKEIEDLKTKIAANAEALVTTKNKLAETEKNADQSKREADSSLKDLSAGKEASAKSVAAAEADKAALEEEKQRLTVKLEETVRKNEELGKIAATAAPLTKEIEDLKTKIAANAVALITTKNKLAETEKNADQSKKEADSSLKDLSAGKEASAKSVAAAEADKAALEEERQRLTAKLEDASKRNGELKKVAESTGPLAKEIESLKLRLVENSKVSDQAKTKNDQALQAASESQSELQRRLDAATGLKQMLEKQNLSLQEQLKAAMGQMASLVDHGQNSGALRTQIEKLQQQMDSSAADYTKSQQQLAELSKARPEQEKLIQQKEKELAAVKQDAEKLRNELAQANQKNANLQRHSDENDDHLKKLQDQLASLSSTLPGKEKQLSDAKDEAGKLQSELADVKSKLSSLQKKSGSGNDQFKDLKDRLEEKEAQLARYKKKRSKSGGDGNLVEENDLLRGIIMRQVKDEARRAQARRLLEDEMKRLNVQSQSLSDQVVVLSAPSAELTPQERSLFKQAQLAVADLSDGKIQESLSARKINESSAVAVMTNQSSNQPVESAVGNEAVKSAEASSSQATNGVSTNTSTNTAPQEIPWEGKLKECLAKAKDEFDRQDYLQSENTFQEALKISPNDYFALSNIGVVEFQLGKMTEAEEFLKRAATKATDSSFALTTLGIVHYRQQRMDDAEKVLKKAVAINQQDFTAHNYLGIVLAASGKGKAGEEEIMKAIEINPQYADAHFNLAVIYATGKPPAKMMAKKHYAKAIELGAPPDPSLERLVQ
jgi:chromosome segregation ATPase